MYFELGFRQPIESQPIESMIVGLFLVMKKSVRSLGLPGHP